MKTLGVLLLAACLVAYTHGFPGSRDSDSESDEKNMDTVLVLPSDMKERFVRPATYDLPDISFEDSINDDGAGFMWPNPFHRLYSGIEPFMRRLKEFRERVSNILTGITEQGVIPWGKIPEGANTTSTVKVINGHVVTINETTYMDGDDEFGTMIRVRIIDVKPENQTILMSESAEDSDVITLPTVTSTARTTVTRAEEGTTALRSVESVEDLDNEIPKRQVDTLTA